MKKHLYKYLIFFFVTSVIVGACNKDESDVRLDPKLSTANVPELTSNSATVVGFVIAQGSGFTEKGICYSTSESPTISDSKVVYSGSTTTATFNVELTGLNYATTYHARAYATGSSETIYGEDITFTTLPVLPTVTTSEFTPKTGTTATGGGSVTNAGGAEVTEYGVCYATTENPTIENSYVEIGSGTGDFTASLSKLQGLTTYYVRAYAKNSQGYAYGNQVSFTTPRAIVILYIVGAFQNWDPANAKDSLMNSEDNSTIEGYAYLTTDEFKFAGQKNWDGTNYGVGSTAGTLSTSGDNLSVSENGYYFFNIDLDKLTYIITKTTWGIVGSATGSWDSDQSMTYSTSMRKWIATIPLTADAIKFRANGAWTYNYGDTDNDGKLEAGGDNIAVATAGTYSVFMDLSSPLNYGYSVTQWGLIGSATSTGWDSDLNMTPHSNNTWTITTTLTAGDIKFRANDAWTFNYGGSSGNLISGGDNITISTAGTYTITLDLSNGTYTVESI
jgi:starch-binding outer membrane protein SusE/F